MLQCRQDVGLYPARHVCYSDTAAEPPPPLPIFDQAMYSRSQASTRTEAPGKPVAFDTASAAAETVERAKVAVGRGWEIVRNINWRDGTRKEPESNGARMWGRLIEATNTARQKVADKYYEVREGGNGLFPPPASVSLSANYQQTPTTTPRTTHTPSGSSRSTT